MRDVGLSVKSGLIELSLSISKDKSRMLATVENFAIIYKREVGQKKLETKIK